MQPHPSSARSPRRSAPYLKLSWGFAIFLALLLGGCAGLQALKQSPAQTLPAAAIPVIDASLPAAAVEATLSPDGLPAGNQDTGTPVEASQTEQAGTTQAPSATSTITSYWWPTRTPTQTSTPTPPLAKIRLLSPGPASRIVSPLKVSADVVPGYRGNVQVDLLGEDGRLLVRKILAYAPVARIHMLTDLEFEIPGVAENGRLVISTEDSYGRKTALASVDVLLLSMGSNDLNPAGSLDEQITIKEPAVNTLIQGGSVLVTGLAHMRGKDPLLIEIIATDGTHVGPSRLAPVTPPDEKGYGTFAVGVPYSVSAPTWVLLSVSELDSAIPGPISLGTVEILLSP